MAKGIAPLWPAVVLIRWGWVFYRSLQRDMAFIRAAGMAYMTLVALVPMLLLVFGALGAVGGLGETQAVVDTLMGQFLGQVPGVREFLEPGLVAVDLGALGLVATGGLVIVAARLYLMVEKAYNDIFDVPIRRKFRYRMLNFYFTITVLPIAVVFLGQGSFEVAAGFGVSAPRETLALSMQFFILVAALRLLPCTPVAWGPAILGSSVSFILLELGRRGFSLYVSWFATDDPLRVVYGSLAVIPLFLVWIYLQWIFVLLGVEVAHTAQNYSSLLEAEREQAAAGRTQYPKLDNALQVAAWVGWHFTAGLGPMSLAELADRTALEKRVLRPVVEVLVEGGILTRADGGVLPARPVEDLPLTDVVAAWRAHTRHAAQGDERVQAEIDAKLKLDGSLADGIQRWIRRGQVVQL